MTERGWVRTATLLGLLAYGSIGLAAETGRVEAIDRLGYEFLTRLDVSSGACDKIDVDIPLPVYLCGRLPRAMRDDRQHIMSAADAVFSAEGATAKPAADQAWAVGKRKLEKGFKIDSVPVTVSVQLKSGNVVVWYPAQFAPCLDPDSSVLDPVAVDVAPVALHMEQPTTPEAARSAVRRGVVQLQAVIRADGTPGEACVQFVNAPGAGLENAALDAWRRWRYTPATIDGKPVSVMTTVSFQWILPALPVFDSSR